MTQQSADYPLGRTKIVQLSRLSVSYRTPNKRFIHTSRVVRSLSFTLHQYSITNSALFHSSMNFLTYLPTPCNKVLIKTSNRFSASQEISRILRNTKAHYRIYKRQSSVPILSHINPLHAPYPTSWRSMCILFSQNPVYVAIVTQQPGQLVPAYTKCDVQLIKLLLMMD